MREKVAVVVIVIVRTALAVGFSLGPIFEGPDEIEHFRYILTLNAAHALPDPYGQPRGEYHQAPLYYLLAWPIAHAVIDDDLEADFARIDGRLNPFYGTRIDTPGSDNKNVYLHARAEQFPYAHSPTALAVHVLRLLSVALGALTVIISFFVARLLWPAAPGKRLLMIGLVAFWPQYLFLSSLINNDNLLVLLATLVLWIVLIQIRQGISWRNAAALGLILGALMLTKVSAIFVFLPASVGFARAFWQDRRTWRGPLRGALLALGIAVITAGWWYLYNWVEYGDPTGTNAVLETWPEEVIRPGKLALDVGLERVPYAYSSVWARFGHGAVPVSAAIYRFFDVLTVLALVGVGIGVARWAIRRTPTPSADLAQGVAIAGFAVVWVFALLYWASTAWSGNQGRYMLPGIGAWSIIFAFGMHAWLPARLSSTAREWFSLGGVIILAGVAGASFFLYFRPAYAVSTPPEDIQHPLHYVFGEDAELIGVSSTRWKVASGDTLVITLYWRALRPAPSDLLTYVHSVENDLVRRDSYPATGNLLATDWRPGEEWADHFLIKIPKDAAPQQKVTLIAGIYDPRVQQAVGALAEGNPTTPIVGSLSIHTAPEPIQTHDAYCFGDDFVLQRPVMRSDNQQIDIDLHWQARRATSIDYTSFVHVLDEAGETIAQADVQPRNGAYPTSSWVRGEVVTDHIRLMLPEPQENWRVVMGLYNPQDFTRLPIRWCDGDSIGDSLELR